MENKSILDTILNNTIREEAAILDSQVILDSLFSVLRDKEREVLTMRFGLAKNEKTTLEAIGSLYNLTRERIRQIENSAINKIKKHGEFDKYTSSLRDVINNLLEEHGGIMEHNYLINNLSYLSMLANSEQKANAEVLKNHYAFILAKLLSDSFDYVKENSHYSDLWKLKFASVDHLEEMLGFMIKKLQELKTVLKTEEIIKLSKENDIYKKYADRLEATNNFDISNIVKNSNFKENTDVINENKALYSLLQASKALQQNKFGHWGIKDWSEITPKTINHKIYLIIKQSGQPMHFREIADKINAISFDSKTANAATVHNELILDDKYILIGRGIYALKEWGYENGTVGEVVAQVLTEAGKPLSKDEIMDGVLKKRLVKKATINLALMDKSKFKKENGKFQLANIKA
ncbi:MAG: sigma factor-like helix-turn-helix DNA-binding protein [Patescibacteria group bacterium]